MGMESYFVKIYFPISEGISVATLAEVIRRSGHKIKVIENQSIDAIADDIVDVMFETHKDFALVTLIGGFSNYQRSMNAIEALLALIKEHFETSRIEIHGETLYIDNDVPWMEAVRQKYDRKYEEYRKIFGDLDLDVAPSRFYDAYHRKHRLTRQIFIKLMRITRAIKR